MTLIVNRAHRDILRLRLFNQFLRDRFRDRKAKSPVAVHHQGCRRFFFDFDFGTGHDMALLDTVTICDDTQHPVRVMSGEIGIDTVPCDDLRFDGTNTGTLENRFGKCF